MKKLIVFMIISLLVFSALATAAGNQPEKVRVFLEFKGKPDAGVVSQAGGRVLHSYTLLDNVLAVEVPVNSLNGLLKNPNVVGVEFDAEAHASGKPAPSQPAQQLPWGVDKVDADLASGTGAGVKVCVVDT